MCWEGRAFDAWSNCQVFFILTKCRQDIFFLFIVRSRTKAGVVFLEQVDCWCLFCLLQDFTDGCRWSSSVHTKFPHTSSTQSKLWQRILFARVHLRERETGEGGGRREQGREVERAWLSSATNAYLPFPGKYLHYYLCSKTGNLSAWQVAGGRESWV